MDNWLRHVRDIHQRRREEFRALADEDERVRRLCEWNVVEQVINVGNTTMVQDAWARGQETVIHGWIHDVGDGLLKDLDVCVRSPVELDGLQRER